MNRTEIVSQILALPKEVLVSEPDTFMLVQEHWQEGLHLYDLYQAGDEEKIRESLFCGSWSTEELYLYLHQLENMQRLLNEL